jgi:hypothetical protein
MKWFNVFYDVQVAYGVLEERCFTVQANFKHEAVNVFRENAPKNAIFRCVKTPLF